MNSAPTVVVLGAGALGLGLIAERASSAGSRVILVARKDDAKTISLRRESSYVIQFPNEERLVAIDEVLRSDTRSGMERIKKVLETERRVLLCTAAHDGQDAAYPWVRSASAVRRRSAISRNGGYLAIAPCENAVSPKLQTLATEEYGAGFAYVDCMVDRISGLSNPAVGRSGRVSVITEAEYEWAAQIDSKSGATLRAVSKALDHMKVSVVANIAPIKLRKKWLMNGAQTALAFNAGAIRRDPWETQMETLVSLGGATFVRDLMGELSWAVEHGVDGVQTDTIQHFANWYCDRIIATMDAPGELDRIVRKYQADGALVPALRDLIDKLASPLDIARQHKVDLPILRRTNEMGLRVLADAIGQSLVG